MIIVLEKEKKRIETKRNNSTVIYEKRWVFFCFVLFFLVFMFSVKNDKYFFFIPNKTQIPCSRINRVEDKLDISTVSYALFSIQIL